MEEKNHTCHEHQGCGCDHHDEQMAHDHEGCGCEHHGQEQQAHSECGCGNHEHRGFGQKRRQRKGCHSANLIPLTAVSESQMARIEHVSGNGEIRSHLATLGFVEGGEVRVVTKTAAGDVIVEIKGSRVALDRGAAIHVMTTSC